MRNIKIYLIYVFVSNFCMLSSFMSMFLEKKGYSLATISVVFGIYQITKFIFEVPTGYIADKYGRKISGIVGLALISLSVLILLLCSSCIGIFYGSMFLKGIGYTFISGSIEALFVESIDEELIIKYNTIERLIFYSSSAIALIIAGYMIKDIGFKWIILNDLIVNIISLILVIFLEEKHISYKKDYKLESLGFNEIFMLKDEALKPVYIMDFATAFVFVAVEDYYAMYLSDNYDLSSEIIGLFQSGQLIFAAIVGMLTPFLVEKIKNDKIIFEICSITSLLALLPIYMDLKYYQIIPICYLFAMVLFSIYAPIKYKYFQQHINNKNRAVALSFQSIMISFGSIFFSAFNWIISHYIKYNQAMILAILTSLIVYIYVIKKIKSNI